MPADPTETSAPPRTTRRTGFDLMRLLCIAGVVAIHTFGAMKADPQTHGSWVWFVAAVLSSGFIWVVPVFVMISGALTLSPSAHVAGPAPFLRRRALRIVPALVVWTFVYLVLIRMLLLGEQLSGTAILTILNDGYAYPHVYFLYLIAGLSFAAPVLAAFLRDGGVRRAVVFAIVVMVFTLVVFAAPGILSLFGIDRPVNPGMLTIWLAYVGYFLLGYALSIVRLPRWATIGAAVVGAAAWVLILYQARNPGVPPVLDAVLRPDYLGAGVAILAAAVFIVGVPLFDRIPLGPRAARIVRSLSDAAFGVYLVHLIVLLVPNELLPGFREHTSLAQTALAYVVIMVASFAIVLVARRIPGVRMVF